MTLHERIKWNFFEGEFTRLIPHETDFMELLLHYSIKHCCSLNRNEINWNGMTWSGIKLNEVEWSA